MTDTVNTQALSDGGGRTFVEHTRPGTCEPEICPVGAGCPDAHSWGFAWTAPATDEPVTFYYCSNATNADCLASGLDTIRCDTLSAVPDPRLTVTYLGVGPGSDVRLTWSGGVPDYRVWMHRRPDFDEPDLGFLPFQFPAGTGNEMVLPDCGRPICYYLVE